MKRFTIVAFMVIFVQTLSAQCPDQLNNWYRILTGTSYTWSWRVSGGGTVKWDNGSDVPNSTIQGYLNNAFAQWQNAANSQGTVITTTYTTDYDNADITVLFSSRGEGSCGQTNVASTPKSISFNSDQNAHWTVNGTGIDLHTSILHEVGHLFNFAGGSYGQHPHPDVNSVMSVAGCSTSQPNDKRIVRTLSACDANLTLNIYNAKIAITIQNNFGNSNGGIVKVDGTNQNSPYTPTNWRASSFPHTAEAIDGQEIPDGNKTYVRRFSQWGNNEGNLEGNIIAIPAQENEYTATFLKEFNITFQNDLPGSSAGGVIKVNGAQQSAPVINYHVREPNSIASEALIYQDIARIDYTFSHWTDELNNTYTSQTVSQPPTDHKTFTAHYSARPQQPANIAANTSQVGDNLTLTWTAHPNPYVSYYIYRISALRNNGQPQLLTTRANNYTSYTDNEFTVGTSGDYDVDNRYDIRSKFSVNNTYSPENYLIVKHLNHDIYIGEGNGSPFVKIGRLPVEYAVDNYPNPFNPSTKISYQIPAYSSVRIVVYDMMARKVKELVNEPRPAGYFDVTWDGTTESGINASSGIYFLYFTAYPGGEGMFSKSIKLLLTK